MSASTATKGVPAVPKVHTCRFVLASEFLDCALGRWRGMLDTLLEDAPFTWGDADHTLVSIGDLAEFIEGKLPGVSLPGLRDAVKRLGDVYVDLEN